MKQGVSIHDMVVFEFVLEFVFACGVVLCLFEFVSVSVIVIEFVVFF